MSKSSLALNNLRAVIILVVFAVHASLAYLGSAAPSAFDKPPYAWRAFPIVDSHRWYGFDIFCAWTDIALMALLFFVSALFSWPSLQRKGTGTFLADRLVRLGIPYFFGVLVLMPISLYAVYRARASDPSVLAYIHHLFALPFWDNGPMWFLWQLLALTVVAGALHRFAPRLIESLGAFSAKAGAHPTQYFLWLTVAALVAYVPLALAVGPMTWATRGPVSIQFCRPLFYLVFYVAGLGAGVRGIDQGLLASDGALARGWSRWLSGNALSLAAWMALMGLSIMTHSTSLALQFVIAVVFAITASSGVLAALAVTLRFGGFTSRVMDGLSQNALGLYFLHYPFSVWLQYALLGAALFAFAKAAIVFSLSLVATMVLMMVLRRLPFGSTLIGDASRPSRARASRREPPTKPSAAIPIASNVH